MKKVIITFLALLILLSFFQISVSAIDVSEIDETMNSAEIQEYIANAMKSELAPAVSMTVTNGEDVIFYNSGFADIKNNIKADETTLYQIGSTTKAFTALAMLVLEDEGMVSLSDNVSKYLPWFKVYYDGKPVEITIKQLIYHSSGLPNSTMSQFKEGTSDKLREETVRLAENIELDFAPGTQYEYCNLGYDILGYLIETITGQKYEDYVKEKILLPLGMTQSGFNITSEKMSKGYVQFFGKAVEYEAPVYQGCLAGGYLITSAKDMSIWLNAQLGKGEIPENLARLIKKSHTIEDDNTVIVRSNESGNSYYTYGWEVTSDGSVISHSGLNPNFTSQIIIDKEKDVAVFVVSNIAGEHATCIGDALILKIRGEEYPPAVSQNAIVDKISSIAIIVEALLFILAIFMFVTQKKRLIKKSDINLSKEKIRLVIKLIILISLFITVASTIYLIGYTYYMAWVWAPRTLMIFIISTLLLLVLFMILSISRFIIKYKKLK